MAEKTERQRAREFGVSVKELRRIEGALRAMPMERFLAGLFPDGGVVYDAAADLWIAADPQYRGPGFGFIAIRRDKSFFCGVIPPETLQ